MQENLAKTHQIQVQEASGHGRGSWPTWWCPLVKKRPVIDGRKVFSPDLKIATMTKGRTGPLVLVCNTNCD
jgi:hypothetical protein